MVKIFLLPTKKCHFLFFVNPGFGLYVIWNARICNKNIFYKCQRRGFSREENPRAPSGDCFCTIYIYRCVCVCVLIVYVHVYNVYLDACIVFWQNHIVLLSGCSIRVQHIIIVYVNAGIGTNMLWISNSCSTLWSTPHIHITSHQHHMTSIS